MLEWNTRLTDMVGCRYPIIQGAYGGFGTAAIAGPVSKTGALGIITAGACKTPDGLREEIEKVRAMTDQPFGVNISVGICPDPMGMLDVVIDTKVPVLLTAAYKAEELGQRAKAAGIPWIHKVATVYHSGAAERQGADAVVIVGLEGAGFKSVSQLPTLINISTVVRMLKVPVVAAGGIGDARGFLACLGMGAEGVYMATAFMATKECPISDRYKQLLVDGQPWDPMFRDRALAPPNRREVDRVMEQREALPHDVWQRQLERVMQGREAEQTEPAAPAAWSNDLQDFDPEQAFRNSGGSLAVGVIDSVKSCQELVDDVILGSEKILESDDAMGRLRAALNQKEAVG